MMMKGGGVEAALLTVHQTVIVLVQGVVCLLERFLYLPEVIRLLAMKARISTGM